MKKWEKTDFCIDIFLRYLIRLFYDKELNSWMNFYLSPITILLKRTSNPASMHNELNYVKENDTGRAATHEELKERLKNKMDELRDKFRHVKSRSGFGHLFCAGLGK